MSVLFEAINAQKTPMKELLADLAFENSLLKMNNEDRLIAIQTRGMDAKSVEEYGDSLRQLNADMEATNETIEAMDEARNSATGFFTDIIDNCNLPASAAKPVIRRDSAVLVTHHQVILTGYA